MIDANGTVFIFERRLRFFNFRPKREERALLFQFVRELKGSLDRYGEFSVNFFQDGDNLHGELLLQLSKQEDSSERVATNRSIQVLGTTLPQLLLEIHYEVAKSFRDKKRAVLPVLPSSGKRAVSLRPGS
ncbi:MAG: hypothetical protein HN353_06975 [Bdellovibrionales bacterium]|jgi:hypothetical protein|nr:hypothetical protein [Bdellovibrionales bacterium]MBT3525274.1 hypothetical protein [Bdellovibrionales bacterium]MBT7667968.1 hypothetical protein [Bdellovibrionales bacterium]MBT7767435.1 hypothetical protein [Bdellovibrionales bacterium]